MSNSSIKVYRYRLDPTYQQKKQIDAYINTSRFLYNKVMNYCILDYDIAKHNFYENYNQYPYLFEKILIANNIKKIKIPGYFYQYGTRVKSQGKGDSSTYKYYVKLKNQYDDIANLPAVMAQDVLDRVESAYQGLFRGNGYPKFKKKGDVNSVVWTQSPPFDMIKIKDNTIKLAKMDPIKMIYHREICKGNIKRVNITKSNTGKYYINIFLQYEIKEELSTVNSRVVGIDRNIHLSEDVREFATLWDGHSYSKIFIPTYWRNDKKEINRVQRGISKLDKGSGEWHHKMQQLRHIYERIDNRKNDWLRWMANDLTDKYGVIILEDLSIKDMMDKEKGKKKAAKKKDKISENKVLTNAKNIRRGFAEVSHNKFILMLQQKSIEKSGKIIYIPPENTTNTCHNCGNQNYQLTGGDREWTCAKCETHHDRDVNAAINIFNLGLKQL